MQQKKQEMVYDILATNGLILEERPKEQRINCLWLNGNRMYHEILIDAQYPQSLLGTVFFEEEWVDGVMQVVFSYPAERRELYETELYSFYVVENGEE